MSTAAWIEGNVARRLACVRQWSVLPDSAGVNFGEPGAVAQQQAVVRAVLESVLEITVPGGVRELPYRWKRETYPPPVGVSD